MRGYASLNRPAARSTALAWSSWQTQSVSINKTVLQFRSSNRADLDEVIAEMRALATDDPGWMHIQPWIDEENVPKRSVFAQLFSSNGPAVPNATWVPGASSGEDRDQLGFTHGSGPGAHQRLRDAGVVAPSGWSTSSDHRHRGLVLVGPDGNHEAVLHFVLAVAAELSTVPTDDRWVYGVARRN